MSGRFVIYPDPRRGWEAVAKWEATFDGGSVLPTEDDFLAALHEAKEERLRVTEFNLNIDSLFGIPVRCGRPYDDHLSVEELYRASPEASPFRGIAEVTD